MSSLDKVSRGAPLVPSVRKKHAELKMLSPARFARYSDEALFWERRNEQIIRLSGVEVAVVSMTTEVWALDRKFAGFGNIVSELVQVQTVLNPGPPL